MSGLAPKRLTATMRRAGGGGSRLFWGMLFLRASPTDRGSRAGWGRVPARGRIFFEGSRDRRGESYWTGEREACRGGGCAGRTGIPGRGGRSLRGGPVSSGGAAQKRVMPDGHFLMWGRALRGRSIGRKSGSVAWTRRATARRKQPGRSAGPGKSAGSEEGRSSRPGQRQARSRAGMRRRGACFPPQGVMVSAGGNVHPWGGERRASGPRDGAVPAVRVPSATGKGVGDRDKGPGAAMGEERGTKRMFPAGRLAVGGVSCVLRSPRGAKPVSPAGVSPSGGGVRFVSGRPPPGAAQTKGQASVHLRRGVDFPRAGAVDRGRLRPTSVPARAVGARTSVPTS